MCRSLTDLHGAANALLSSALADWHHVAVGAVLGRAAEQAQLKKLF
jgi:hypothetical protein